MADLMVRHHTLPELYHEMAVGLRKVADFQFLNFSLYHPENKAMHLHFLEGEPATGFPKELPVWESATGWCWQHQQELLFQNLDQEKRFPRVLEVLRSKGIRTYYVLPLTSGEKRMGALGVASVKAMHIKSKIDDCYDGLPSWSHWQSKTRPRARRCRKRKTAYGRWSKSIAP